MEHLRLDSNQPAMRDRKSNLLYQRLEEALQQGQEIWVRALGSGFSGIPIHLDHEFLEIVSVYVPDESDSSFDVDLDWQDDEDEDPYQRTVWLIRIADISAVAYSTESWSKERFEQLLGHPQSPKDAQD
ncbi:MAG: hypothetical protein ACTS2F_25005 [Thainema sp.]